MHDGSLKTLMEVVEHYNKGGTPNAYLDEEMFPLKLTNEEKGDLVKFLEEGCPARATRITRLRSCREAGELERCGHAVPWTACPSFFVAAM